MLISSPRDKAFLERALTIVEQAPFGDQTLPEMCGDSWKAMEDYRSFSRRFRTFAEYGMLPGISIRPEKSANDTLVYRKAADSREREYSDILSK